MSRCVYCQRRIWPWQSAGWRVLTHETIRRWHGRCYRATERCSGCVERRALGELYCGEHGGGPSEVVDA